MKSLILCILLTFSVNLYALDKVNKIDNAIHDCVVKNNRKCDGDTTCKEMINKMANTPSGDRLYKFTYKILYVKSEKVYEGVSQTKGSENDDKEVVTYKCDVKFKIEKVIPFSSKNHKCEEVTEQYVICDDRRYVFESSIFDDLKRGIKKVEDSLDTVTKPISLDAASK